MRIYIVFLKIPEMNIFILLYFTYQLVQMFITCNRTDVSLFKQVSELSMEKELS